jgi:hypothetical protein
VWSSVNDKMVLFQVHYWREAEPRIVDVTIQNGRLMLLTLLEATELAFVVEKQTGNIVSPDLEGCVIAMDLTAEPVGIEGRRRLREFHASNTVKASQDPG